MDDTSEENPPCGEGPNWDDYWKHWTKELFDGAVCACCGEPLTASNRVGAHIRLAGEEDNTKDAWIALYCSSGNNRHNEDCHDKLYQAETLIIFEQFVFHIVSPPFLGKTNCSIPN